MIRRRSRAEGITIVYWLSSKCTYVICLSNFSRPAWSPPKLCVHPGRRFSKSAHQTRSTFVTSRRSSPNSRRGVPRCLSLAERHATRLWRIIDGWRVSDRLARQQGVHVGPPLGARLPQPHAPSTSLCALEGQENILFVFVTSSSRTTDGWRCTTPSAAIRDLARPNYSPNGGDREAIHFFVLKSLNRVT